MRYNVILLATGAIALAGKWSRALPPYASEFPVSASVIGTLPKASSGVFGQSRTLLTRSIDDDISARILQRRGNGSKSKNKKQKSRGSGGSGNASGSGSGGEVGSRVRSGSQPEEAPTGPSVSSRRKGKGSSPAQPVTESQDPNRMPIGRPPRPASTSSLTSLSRGHERALSRLSLADTATSPAGPLNRGDESTNKFTRYDHMEKWEQVLQRLQQSPPTTPKSPPSSPPSSAYATPRGSTPGSGSGRSPGFAYSRPGSSDSLHGRKESSSRGTKRLLMSSPRGSLGSPSTSAGAASSSGAGGSNWGSSNSLAGGLSPMTSPRGDLSVEQRKSLDRGGLSIAKIGSRPFQEASAPSDERSNSPSSFRSRGTPRDTSSGGVGGGGGGAGTSSSSPQRSPRERADSPSSPRSSGNPFPGPPDVGLSELREVLSRPRPQPPRTHAEFITQNKDVLAHLNDMVSTQTPAPMHLISDAEGAKKTAKQARMGERHYWAIAKDAVDSHAPSSPTTVRAVRDYTRAASGAVTLGLKSVRAKQEAAKELPGTAGHNLAATYVKSASREYGRINAQQTHYLAFEKEHAVAKMAETGPPRRQASRGKFELDERRAKNALPELRDKYAEASRDYEDIKAQFTAGESSSEDEERPLRGSYGQRGGNGGNS